MKGVVSLRMTCLEFYSVITGSNVQSANVRKIASQRSETNPEARHRFVGRRLEQAAVPRTPAIITGIVMGYSKTGSSVSRLLTRTSIAANSVPTAANPIVPVASSVISMIG